VQERLSLQDTHSVERHPIVRRESRIGEEGNGGTGLSARYGMRIAPLTPPPTSIHIVPGFSKAPIGEGSDVWDANWSACPLAKVRREAGGGIDGGERLGERLDERHAGQFPTDSTLPNCVDSAIGMPGEGKDGRGCQRATVDSSCHGSMIGGLGACFPQLLQPAWCTTSRTPSIEANPIGKLGLTTRPPKCDPKCVGGP
jgi:hypothetical protein